jgi:hypothetical protein
MMAFIHPMGDMDFLRTLRTSGSRLEVNAPNGMRPKAERPISPWGIERSVNFIDVPMRSRVYRRPALPS